MGRTGFRAPRRPPISSGPSASSERIGPMNILGISCFFHDAAAALLVDGRLVAAAEEERFTRRKHDYSFPENAIRFCLAKGKLEGRDLDYVVFFEKPFVKFERILMTSLQMFPRSWRVFREAMLTWLSDKLWVKSTIQRGVGVDGERVLFSEHHLSHAASAFFCSPFDEAAILTVDGVGGGATASLGVGRGTEIRLLREPRFPHSLGLLYSAFTAFLGFEVNEGEYKVMGMAPYGRARYVDEVGKLIHVCAASIQAVTEDVLLKMAHALHRETGLTRLCLAGGVALNSVANGRILRETPFEELYIQPSAGDGGGALGAALYAQHALLGQPRRFVMDHAFWGEEYSAGEIHEFLRESGIRHETFEHEEGLLDRVAGALQEGKVAGWFQGRVE